MARTNCSLSLDRGIMGLRPTKGDEKRFLFSNDCRWRHRPPLCHLDRNAAQWRDLRFSGPFLEMVFDRGAMGLWPTQGDEKRLLFSNNCQWRHRPPLCHLDRSAAQWRDLRFCGPFLGMFFDRGVMGLWPTQGDEKRLLFSNNCRWRHRPPLCHLDRSAAQWRDLRFSGPFLGMCFRQRSHGPLAHPR